MKDVLQYLKIPPQLEGPGTPGQQSNANIAGNPHLDMKVELTVPSLINLSVAEAEKLAAEAGLRLNIEGLGARVADQLPKPGSKVYGGTQVLLYTEPRFSAVNLQVTVPDLQGKSVQQAGELLGNIGLLLEASGSGKALHQEPGPGMKVAPGSTIHVTFAEPKKPEQENEKSL